MSQQIICPRGASLYIWRQGDTLASVALRNRVTVQSIYLVNEGRDLDALRPGDRICLPPGMYACLSGQAYTVRRGDTFASIAQAYGITTWELIERNPYVDPSNLMVGQVLCVPENQACPPGNTYTLDKDETMETVALLLNVSLSALLRANPCLAPSDFKQGACINIPED